MDWTQIVVAAIAGVALVISSRESKRGKRMERHTAEIHEQVRNSHTTNLRDDVDSVTRRLDRISADIGDVKHQTRATSDKVDAVQHKVDQLDQRLSDHIDGR